MEEFIHAEVNSYDAIIDGNGEPIFETGNVTPMSVMDIVNNNDNSIYYIVKDLPEDTRKAGRATVKSFGVKNRFVHFEFFRLLEDHEGLGKKGDVMALEVNMRPCGGFTPDMINFAHSTNVYKIWADMICYDSSLTPVGEHNFCAFAGRRDGKNFVLDHDALMAKYGHCMKMVDRIPDALSGAMGNQMYVANFPTKEAMDEFYKDALAAEAAGGKNAYTAMAREAAAIPAGSEGLVCLPYFAGERTPLNDPFAKGVFFGLSVKHTRAHMVKAGLEGIAYTIAAHLDLLEKEHGEPLRRIMAVGGGTKNPVWLQAVADVTGRQICTAKVTVGAAFGDAIMAALAGGAYADWDELAKVITADRVICPDMQAHAVYEKQRVVFNELYARNRDLMKSL